MGALALFSTGSAAVEARPRPAISEPDADGEQAAAFDRVAVLFERRCMECHAGAGAEAGLRLERDRIHRSTVNVPAYSDRTRRLVDPNAPERSELYLRLLPPDEGGYKGPRMPMRGEPLTDAEVALVRDWIASFPADRWPAPPADAADLERRPPSFADTHLAHLPTPETLGDGMLEFRILHRFREAVDAAGSEGLYGLDGGAEISFGLAYGLTDRVDVGLRRTNFQQDFEGYGRFVALSEQRGGAPVSLAFQAGVAVIDAEGRANRTRFAAQAMLGRRIGRRLSLVLVPTYVTRTNFLDREDERGTAAVGVGAEWRWSPIVSTSVEWVAQTSGVKAPYESASLGLAISTSKHVFTLLVTNTRGLHTDLYAPGGDLDLGDGELRLGFNISRRFDVERRHGR